ncbi:cysteine hydrolase [Rhodobacteraceae bacterium]|nr:cysteine hydrolase [Paracoccaceae bacterium]
MPRRAILVVDLQNEYWPTGKLPLHGIEQAAANAAKVVQHARTVGDLVVNIRHESPDGPIFVPGSDGAEINKTVAPREDEAVITKAFPNAFRDTGLKELLDQHGITNVVVIGAMSHMCIDATTRAANDLGYETTTLHDACATRDIEFGTETTPADQVQVAIMGALAFAYGDVIDTDAFLKT